MSAFDQFVRRNRQFERSGERIAMTVMTANQVFVVSCNDPRVGPAGDLGIGVGDAIVLRNPGGRVTDAAITDTGLISFMGVDGPPMEVAVIHHTQCGMGFLANSPPSHPDPLGPTSASATRQLRVHRRRYFVTTGHTTSRRGPGEPHRRSNRAIEREAPHRRAWAVKLGERFVDGHTHPLLTTPLPALLDRRDHGSSSTVSSFGRTRRTRGSLRTSPIPELARSTWNAIASAGTCAHPRRRPSTGTPCRVLRVELLDTGRRELPGEITLVGRHGGTTVDRGPSVEGDGDALQKIGEA